MNEIGSFQSASVESVLANFSAVLLISLVVVLVGTVILLARKIHKLVVVSAVEVMLATIALMGGKQVIVEFVIQSTSLDVSGRYGNAGDSSWEHVAIIALMAILVLGTLRDLRMANSRGSPPNPPASAKLSSAQ